ncbi:hypothetical protein BGW80DRAFT_1291712 [Lactifluus volemus]|nr:hypothetical protein BGW80DRAFT_1291712 [Lactifluus volemus]
MSKTTVSLVVAASGCNYVPFAGSARVCMGRESTMVPCARAFVDDSDPDMIWNAIALVYLLNKL